MKFFISVFSVYFLLLCAVPCSVDIFFDKPDVCCQADSGNHSSEELPADNCNGCNPLSSCHCTGTFISFTQGFIFQNIFIQKDIQVRYLVSYQPSFPPSIWQPPKFS